MPRYAAFLRGVSPMNCRMPALKKALEDAGFTNVVTVLSSGNVVFDTRSSSPATIAKKAEQAMAAGLGKAFSTIVRSIEELTGLLESDPFASFRLAKDAKRVVTLLRDEPTAKLKLPLELDGARILAVKGREVFTAYVPSPKGAAFMQLIEKTFGKDVTTRTWDTLKKVSVK